jgi:hypothetical protein
MADQGDSIGDLGQYLIGAWAIVYLGIAVRDSILARVKPDL